MGIRTNTVCHVRFGSQINQSGTGATAVNYWNGNTNLLYYSLFVNILSWYVQIHLGHHILEGASPAVTKSVGGALTSAPLFAFYEGLWLFGINKQLHERTIQLVAHYTSTLCNDGAAMRICANITAST